MDKPTPSYEKVRLGDGLAYVRKGVVKDLEKVDAIIFDVDGVMIDARRSYDRTIKKTAAYIFKNLTTTPLPRGIITSRLIYRFRSRGGFNSDWDTTYAILLKIFSLLPQQTINTFKSAYNELSTEAPDNLGQRLSILKRKMAGKIDSYYIDRIKKKGEDDLLKLASDSDSSGIRSIECILFESNNLPIDVREGLAAFKSFLHYPGSVKESIISRVFDEVFYGPEFFQQVHGLKPIFSQDQGLIDTEKIIVKKETLCQLAGIVGQHNLSIASGRGSKSTKRTLQDLMEFINPNAMVFMEDEESYMNPRGKEREKLGKPQPYSLLKAKEGLTNPTRVIYVGDSAEDLLMVQNAGALDNTFLFAGVYATGFSPGQRLRLFKNQRADILIPSINDLPYFLKLCKGMGECA